MLHDTSWYSLIQHCLVICSRRQVFLPSLLQDLYFHTGANRLPFPDIFSDVSTTRPRLELQLCWEPLRSCKSMLYVNQSPDWSVQTRPNETVTSLMNYGYEMYHCGNPYQLQLSDPYKFLTSTHVIVTQLVHCFTLDTAWLTGAINPLHSGK